MNFVKLLILVIPCFGFPNKLPSASYAPPGESTHLEHNNNGGGNFNFAETILQQPSGSSTRNLNNINSFPESNNNQVPKVQIANNVKCGRKEARGVDGECVPAEVSRKIYIFNAPVQHRDERPQVPLPKPKLNYNIVFVRTPEKQLDEKPVVIPPPVQKTLIYVLNEQSDDALDPVIEIPTQTHQPEVFYINYNEGDNPELPFGIDLETAISNAVSKDGQDLSSLTLNSNSFTDLNIDPSLKRNNVDSRDELTNFNTATAGNRPIPLSYNSPS